MTAKTRAMLAAPIYLDSYSPSSCYHDRRRATQPPFIAGPLAQIFKNVTVSPRALFNMFRLDKIISALIPELAPRSIDNLPSRRHMKATVIKSTILPFTWTLPSLDEQILVLTAKSQINVTGQT